MTSLWKNVLPLAVLVAFGLMTSAVSAQDSALVRGAEAIELFDQPSASVQRESMPSAAELRHALAWHQHLQRAARIEAAQWNGYHLSRPPGIVTPSTTSRYPYFQTIIIPVFVDNLRR